MDDLDGALMRMAAQIRCPHGGIVMAVPDSEVWSEYLLDNETYVVVGCDFKLPSGKASPCARVRWQVVSQAPDPVAEKRRKVTVPPPRVLRWDSVGLCVSHNGAPQGQAQIFAFGLPSAPGSGNMWNPGLGGGSDRGNTW